MQTLWREQAAAYSGDLATFEKIHLNPKPLHECGVPLWISGRLNKNVLQRIVRFGSGWIPWGEDAMDPIGGLAMAGPVMTSSMVVSVVTISGEAKVQIHLFTAAALTGYTTSTLMKAMLLN